MLLQNLQKALRTNNQSSLAKDDTSGPFVATSSSVRKNDNNNNNNNNNKNNPKMVLVCAAIHFRLKFQRSLLLLHLIGSVSKGTNITSKCY